MSKLEQAELDKMQREIESTHLVCNELRVKIQADKDKYERLIIGVGKLKKELEQERLDLAEMRDALTQKEKSVRMEYRELEFKRKAIMLEELRIKKLIRENNIEKEIAQLEKDLQ